MNKRRNLLIAIGAAAFAPRAVLAQSKQPVLIGWLHFGSRTVEAQFLTALKEGLGALGWKDGFSYVVEERWADGQTDRLQPLAEELAVRKPAIIVAGQIRSAIAAAKAAPKIPIVMVIGGDPVTTGVVASLARPGGMITGVTAVNEDINEKFLELLLAAVPNLRRVGFLADSTTRQRAAFLEAARRSVAPYSVEARVAEVASAEEIEPAMSRLAKEGAQALVVLAGALVQGEQRRIIKLALARRWPIIGGPPEWAEQGALLNYGTDRPALYRRAAYYVDRILKGAKPGDLPIEQPTKFELVVNVKTAKALGLTLPQPFLMRADKVIE